MKNLSREKAIDLAVNPEAKVYMLMRISSDTTLEQLTSAEGFCYEEPTDVPVNKKTVIDHGKICALYNAGWTLKNIAEECKCSISSVNNHLVAEGLKED